MLKRFLQIEYRGDKTSKTNEAKKELKELQSIKNLLIIHLLKSGATSEDVDLAIGMGAGNVRTKFGNVKPYPGVTKKGKSQDGN